MGINLMFLFVCFVTSVIDSLFRLAVAFFPEKEHPMIEGEREREVGGAILRQKTSSQQ